MTDYSLAKHNKKPIFAIPILRHKDGGTVEYYGLGYKVIKYNKLDNIDSNCVELYRQSIGNIDGQIDLTDSGCVEEGKKDTVFGFWTLEYKKNN
jgi:hypothetical protein